MPWAFKICGIFQAVCDLGLGLQWFVWRDGPEGDVGFGGGGGGVERGPFETREKVMKSPPPERDAFELDAAGLKAPMAVGWEKGRMERGWERQRMGM